MQQRPEPCLGRLLPLLTFTLVAGLLLTPWSARAASSTMLRSTPHIVWGKGRAPTSGSATTSNVIYHGGPVMAGNMKAYAIFWEPNGSVVSSTYNQLLQRYFGDVGDAGLYANNQQYTDTKGRAPEEAKLAGSFVDTSPYPSAPFLQDADIRHEITHAMSVNGWKPAITHAFFVYTALNEFICSPFGFCSAPSSGLCSYHFGFSTPGGVVLYGAMPYAGNSLTICYPGLSGSPNHDIDADAAINLTSHEQMELATDPEGTGWSIHQASSMVRSLTNAPSSLARSTLLGPTSRSTAIPISCRKSGTTPLLAACSVDRNLTAQSRRATAERAIGRLPRSRRGSRQRLRCYLPR
jgi:hypothetical protein